VNCRRGHRPRLQLRYNRGVQWPSRSAHNSDHTKSSRFWEKAAWARCTARDTKLKREVAIKVLPDEFSRDADRLSRFQREAEVLASLNHPNIAAIYDLEEANGSQFLVLELVDGETIADRLKRGAIPVDEALEIAKHICEALEAAHEKGIVHRDLKPANVKITPDGKVKVLDFGLARALERAPANANFSNSPTLSMMATNAGVILGTAAYMSPEQAKGRPADKRSDVWAFGCVLYEMCTGKIAFNGEDVSDTLAAVLRAEPDRTALPADLSPCVRALIDGCLKKDRRDRIADMSTARFLMSEPVGLLQATAPPSRGRSRWSRALPIAMAVLVLVALAIGVWLSRRSTSLPVSRSTFVLPEGQTFSGSGLGVVAISPDGSHLAYGANGQLYIRSMSDFDSKVILGTEGSAVTSPTFSPDGRSIVFYSGPERAIKRISTSGGPPMTVCTVDEAPYSITWGPDDIVFTAPGKGIMRVAAKGGSPELLLKLNAGEEARAHQILPDGQTVLFTLVTDVGAGLQRRSQVVVQSLKTAQRKPLISNAAFARYVPTGYIVYVSGSSTGGTLFAVPFDASRQELTGEAMPMIEGVRTANDVAHFSFSETGTFVYMPGRASGGAGPPSTQLDLALVDRKGGVQPLRLPPASYQHPRVSPDGKQVAYFIDDGKESNIWLYNLSGTSAPRRLTFGGKNRFPIWSGTGQRIAFQSDREGDAAIYAQRADISGVAERLTKPEQSTVHIPESWSPNGETLLFSVTKGSDTTLWTLSLRDKKTSEFAGIRSTTPTDAVFSPDGRWVAYISTTAYTQPRHLELDVQPFPPNGEKYLISSGVGIHPVWASNGGAPFRLSSPADDGERFAASRFHDY
jgi:serine/threonine-protein kinase